MNVIERRAARFVISGQVQGVGFRAATRREAQRLQIDGHAINQADGSVEVIAEGSDAALHELEDWLHRGPAFARVQAVLRSELSPNGRKGFGVG